MIKKTVLVLIICGAIISLQYMRATASTNVEVKGFYLKQIETLKAAIENFRTAVDQKLSNKDLQTQFSICRISYKKLAVLTDYFNQYETRFINSPAISRIESEVADRIIPPSGFQAIEDILFNNWDDNNYKKISSLLNDILQILHRLEKEPDMEYKFKDELVWDAIRSATFQLITSGITGLDSPTANYSLAEGAATINGIQQLLNFFKPVVEEKNATAWQQLTQLINKAKAYINRKKSFNEFDRLTFITDYVNPFYKCLVQTRINSGIDIPSGTSAINYNATSPFDEDALSINFYSPPEEYWVTPERILLGKKLFSDPILSGNKTRSCASCHQPEKAFTDGLPKPFALDNKTVLTRNTPTLYNAGFQTSQFFDSRADILENQLGEVVHNIQEMSGSLHKSVADLKKDVLYKELFDRAYPKEPINNFIIANAISSYIRSLHSLNARFDQYIRGDKKQLNAAEKKGFNLFMGKAKCATCHFIPLFNGAVPPLYTTTESEVLGVPKTKNKNPAQLDDDLGKYLFIKSDVYKHSFKTPTLRNIELTAPYMHNGVFDTLEEVMEFYNNGGGKGLHIAPENQTLPFDKLSLSKQEIMNIIAFMKTLTDTTTTKNLY